MTILTKPSNEKKTEKNLPLVDEVAMLAGTAPSGTLLRQQSHDASDVDAESMVFNRAPHITCMKTTLLFLISLILMMMGVFGGYLLYRVYFPSHFSSHYRAICDIPYQNGNITVPRFWGNADDLESSWSRWMSSNMHELDNDNYFREEIQLDTSEDQSFTKVDVPDFRDGRRGRFIHDFKENQSAIIDSTANRCFVMPLDRETTLPPKSFIDLMQKMGTGYYNIDTDHIRRHMRVALPSVDDLTTISERIGTECFDMKIYMLEKYNSGVFKRAAIAPTENGKFAEFSGKKIVEFDIMNIADVDAYERKQHQQ